MDTQQPEARPPLGMLASMLAPLQLLWDYRSLAFLALAAALLCLPEVTLTDVSAQYALDEFNLIASDNKVKQREVSLLFQWPGYALLMPAFFITGLVAKRMSALKVLLWLIPLTGLAMSLPVLLRVAPKMWLVPIVGVSQPLGMVVFVPLQTLISQMAPPDRVGEAMGVVGASKQAAGLFSNLLVGSLAPVLVDSGLQKPLWVFYPLATASSLVAFMVALQIKGPQDARGVAKKLPKMLCVEGTAGNTPASSAHQATPRSAEATELEG